MSTTDTTAVAARPQQLEVFYTGCNKVAVAKSLTTSEIVNPFTVQDLSCCDAELQVEF